jgi:hypothetical protein
MEKILIVLFLSTLFAACGQKTKQEVSKDHSDTTQLQTKTKLNLTEKYVFTGQRLIEFENAIAAFDGSSMGSIGVVTAKFHSILNNQDRATCDSAFYLFEQFYSKIDRNLNEQHSKVTRELDSIIFKFSNEWRTKLPQRLADYVENLRKNGYDISMTEGPHMWKRTEIT